VVVRCEHDSVLAPGTYINVKALNEWESKVRMIDSPNGVGENVVGESGGGECGGGECDGGHFDLRPHSKGESMVRMIATENGVGGHSPNATENGVGGHFYLHPT
jgi:hypothetical protein